MSSLVSTPYYGSRAQSLNLGITRTFVGLNVAVHTLWNFSEGGIAYNTYRSLRQSLGPQSLLPAVTTYDVKRVLQKHFLLVSGSPGSWNLLGHAISHQQIPHLIANLFSFWVASDTLIRYLPPLHYASLMVTSAITSGLAFLYSTPLPNIPTPQWFDFFSSPRTIAVKAALGASGVVSALTACAAAFEPNKMVKVGFIPIAVPLWMAAVGYNVVDALVMQTDLETGLGHSSHLGGAATGLVFYLLVGRRFAAPWSWLGPQIGQQAGGGWGRYGPGRRLGTG